MKDFWIITNFIYIYMYICYIYIYYLLIESSICQAKIRHVYVCRIFSKRHHIVCRWRQTRKIRSVKEQCTTQGTCKNGMDAEFSSFRRCLSWKLLPLSKHDGVSEKKALACGWQIGVSLRRRLEGCGMSRRVDGFPAGKHDERICMRFARGRAQEDKRRNETEDDSTKRVLHLPIFLLFPLWKEKKTYPPAARLISLILASGARSKNKSMLGMCREGGDRNWGVLEEKINSNLSLSLFLSIFLSLLFIFLRFSNVLYIEEAFLENIIF